MYRRYHRRYRFLVTLLIYHKKEENNASVPNHVRCDKKYRFELITLLWGNNSRCHFRFVKSGYSGIEENTKIEANIIESKAW